MSVSRVMTGNLVVALAVTQVKPDVAVVYPIIPTTAIVEEIAASVADGSLFTEILNMESDGNAMSACLGAALAGGRVFTVASSQALLAMHEFLFTASSLRLPVVAAVVNRALPSPLAMGADHADAMTVRESGWVQMFCEDPQEAYDTVIQAFRIAEHGDIRAPVMVGMDAFFTSHTFENVLVEEAEDVEEFVGPCGAGSSVLDTETPRTVGSFSGSDYYFEHKVNQFQALDQARKIIKEVGKEFGDRFGRYYGCFEAYKLEDADFALLLMGSCAGAAKEWIDTQRSNGGKVGLLKLRLMRPFPHLEIKEALTGLKAVAVLDRAYFPGTPGGPLFAEIRSALYDTQERPVILPYVYGLGGRDIQDRHFDQALADMMQGHEKAGQTTCPVQFLNVRE